MQEKQTKTMKVAAAADNLSLGISIIVAIIIGIAIGFWLKGFFGIWGLVFGIVLGILAAINNIYKAYKAQIASYSEFSDTYLVINNKDKIAKDDEIDENKHI